MLCRNLISNASEVIDEDGSHLLTCNMYSEADLDFATDDDVRGAMRRLERYADDPDFELRQQACGFRFEPHGLLMHKSLDHIVKPVKQYCHDWMHCMMVNGVFTTTAYLLLASLAAAGMKNTWEMLHEYMQAWTWPSHVERKYADVFNPKRSTSSKKAQTLKATASECIAVYRFVMFLKAYIFGRRPPSRKTLSTYRKTKPGTVSWPSSSKQRCYHTAFAAESARPSWR